MSSTEKQYRVAVAGATGLVGETMMEILEQRKFPVSEIIPLASSRSAGGSVRFRGRQATILELSEFDFAGVDIALFSAGGSVSAEHAPRAADAGCVVIDNTSHFRYESDIPLVVPEVNPDAVAGYRSRGIIANPNCSTIQLLLAVKPLHDYGRVTRINVATYQAVSGAGRSAVENLAGQTASLMNGRSLDLDDSQVQIAFNALPQIDDFQSNGYTREEMKMVWESQKILADDSILVNPTAVRVPVFFGHSEAVHLETERKIDANTARELLQAAPGVTVMDDPGQRRFPTAAIEGAGSDAVWVGRIREDLSHPRGLDMWVVSDNVRKGAALNSVQIAEILVKNFL